MKSIFPLLVLTCLLTTFLTHGQNLSFGAHAIGILSTFDGPVAFFQDEDLSENKIGYGIGGSITYNLGKYFDLRSELNLERKGAKYSMFLTDENGNTIDRKHISNHLDYLSVPLLVQLKLGSRYKFLVNIGTSVHFLLHQQSDKVFEVEGEKFGIPSIDNISDFHRTDYSILGGVGFVFPFLKTKQIYLDARYVHGFWYVTKETDVFGGKNRAFVVQTGVQF